ncbi:MAG: 50S ribosomal protein L18 [Alphaproteobacteria bacterium]|nr:50S ribosomal protein L18 [Alphaproteobacteria bacterium]
MKKNDMKLARRKARVRYEIKMKSGGRPRLSVYRSEKNVYAQVIDDTKGITLAAASSKEKGFSEKGSTVAGAALVGKMVAEKALKAGVKQVVFDRSGYMYHGRVKAIADAAREAGLDF